MSSQHQIFTAWSILPVFVAPKLILLHTAASWSALFFELRSESPLNLNPLALFGRHVDALEADCCQGAQEIREVELNAHISISLTHYFCLRPSAKDQGIT